jgi:HEAT repeat protein
MANLPIARPRGASGDGVFAAIQGAKVDKVYLPGGSPTHVDAASFRSTVVQETSRRGPASAMNTTTTPSTFGPPVQRSRRWFTVVSSSLTGLLAICGVLIVLRLLIVPIDTSKHNGKTAKQWIALLGSDDITIRSTAKASLEEMGGEAVSNLGYALRDSDVQIRRGAVGVLYNICDDNPQSVEFLARALRDSDSWVRWQAAKGLRRMGEQSRPAALALANAVTTDPDSRVRLVCVQALERIGDGAIMAHPALIKALSDEQFYVRQAAASAIKVVAPDKPVIP